MSGAVALPGADFLSEICLFMKNPLVKAAALPGAELFLRNLSFLEEATCPGQLRCLGQNFFSEISLVWKKPLVWGSCAAWGRTVSQKPVFWGGSNHLSGAASLPVLLLFT